MYWVEIKRFLNETEMVLATLEELQEIIHLAQTGGFTIVAVDKLDYVEAVEFLRKQKETALPKDLEVGKEEKK